MADFEKEALDLSTKRMIIEAMEAEQTQMLAERQENVKLLKTEERPRLPKTLCRESVRIQKFVTGLKNIGEFGLEKLREEFELLNLQGYIPVCATNMALNSCLEAEQRSFLEMCILLHQKYDGFAEPLIKTLESQFKATKVTNFSQKRAILRILTELYFKGLTVEYQGIFKCLVQMILINYEETPADFMHGLKLISDYLKTFGEQIFLKLSTEHRESIDNGYEVTIERHDFLGELKRHRLIEYLTKNYFENKCIAYVDSLYENAKKDLEKWEKSKNSENPEDEIHN